MSTRHLTTVQEIGRLAQRVGQLIVLSHSKPFLCQMWESADKTARAVIEIARSEDGSTLRGWVVHHDLISEHDRRHALLRDYLVNTPPDNRKVAEALRPVLERFVRVAYPDWCAPGDMLGKFANLCQQHAGKFRSDTRRGPDSRARRHSRLREPFSSRHQQGLRNRGHK